jgi:Uma2 family endonuclease
MPADVNRRPIRAMLKPMTAAVALGFPARQIDYPESDGAPVGETDYHIDAIFDVRAGLKLRYRDDANVYVGNNMFLYCEEGDPTACFAPDAFVVFGVPKRRRRTYKLWEEKRAPAFVLEVTSRKTRLEDKGTKKELCAEIKVQEYFLFDPEADYLKPPLQGFRLVSGQYEQIPRDAGGKIESKVLGLLFSVDTDGRLRMVDATTEKPLLRIDEQAARAEQEAKRANEAEARASAAEAELAKLRALLGRS